MKDEGLRRGLSYGQEMPIASINLHDDGVAQARAGVTVAEHDPPIHVAPLPPPGPGDVDGLVAGEAGRIALLKNGDGSGGGIIVQDAVAAAGGILGVALGKEEHGAERDPHGVEPDGTARHGRYHTHA